jgi:hypothetical protein
MKKLFSARTALIAVFGLLLAFRSSSADNDSAHMRNPTLHSGFLGFGSAWVGDSKLNDKLKSMGIPAFMDYGWSLSLGNHVEYGRMITEAALSGNFWMDSKSMNLRTSLWCADAVINLGCNTLPDDMTLRLFPFIGIPAERPSPMFRNYGTMEVTSA